MTPEQWQQINDMFHAALAVDCGQRFAFLDTECDGDDALRARVGALLTSHQEMEGFIAGSVFADAAHILVEDGAQAMIGQRIVIYITVSHGLLGSSVCTPTPGNPSRY